MARAFSVHFLYLLPSILPMKHTQSLALLGEAQQMQSQLSQNREVNRLLSAAVVNRRFCTLLLADPSVALKAGYNGDAFHLSAEEASIIQSIHASTLQDFAAHLLETEYTMTGEVNYSVTKTQAADPASVKVKVGL